MSHEYKKSFTDEGTVLCFVLYSTRQSTPVQLKKELRPTVICTYSFSPERLNMGKTWDVVVVEQQSTLKCVGLNNKNDNE